MRQYIFKNVETVKETEFIICNKCGKKIRVKNECPEEGVFSADHMWGYFSQKDGERHKFDLCEDCYDELLESFSVPVEMSE